MKKDNLNDIWVPLKFSLMAKKIFSDETDKEPIKFLLKQILNIEVEDVNLLDYELDDYYKDDSAIDLIAIAGKEKMLIEVKINEEGYDPNRSIKFMYMIDDYKTCDSFIQINIDYDGPHEGLICEYNYFTDKTGEMRIGNFKIIRIDAPLYNTLLFFRKNASVKEKFIGLLCEYDKKRAKMLTDGNRNMESIYNKIANLSSVLNEEFEKSEENRKISWLNQIKNNFDMNK